MFDKKLIKNILILLGSILMLASAFITFILHETQDEIEANPKNIRYKLQSYLDEDEMAGFSVSVFDADSVYFQEGFGYADVEKHIPYSPKTLQYTASICKTVIGFCLLKAEELGLLKLSHPINEYLPFSVVNPAHPQEEITLQHLATHTSSLDYNEEVVEALYVEEGEKNASLTGFMEAYFVEEAYGPIAFTEDQPGTNYNYSNIGAGLAAFVIEQRSGMTFDSFSQTYLFEPLGMEQSAWFEQVGEGRSYASYYEPMDEKIVKVQSKGVQLYPVRDMLTNAEELTHYAQAMLRQDRTLLPRKAFRNLLNPALSSSVENLDVDGQALFWMIDRNQYGVVYELTGSNGGDYCINSMLWLDRYTGMGYIFLGNTGGSEANQGNHIWIYRALVSLGDYILMNNPKTSTWDKVRYTWHNLSSRVGALF